MSTVRPLVKYKVSCGSSPNIQNIFLDDNDTIETVVEQDMRISYQKGFNEISVEYLSENVSLNRFEIRLTPYNEEYGLGLGTLLFETYGSLAGSTWHKAKVDVNAITFPAPGSYRLAFYCRSSIDNTWSYKFLVFSVDLQQITAPSSLGEYAGKPIYALVNGNI